MSSFGKSLTRAKQQEQQRRRAAYVQAISERNEAADQGTINRATNSLAAGVVQTQLQQGHDPNNLKSVWDQTEIDSFLQAADSRSDAYASNRSVKVVMDGSAHVVVGDKIQPLSNDSRDWLGLSSKLPIPHRPSWSFKMKPSDINVNELSAFASWRESLNVIEESNKVLLSPYEKNLEVWRQLWRVVERADVVVNVVDARNPLAFRCRDFENYVSQHAGQTLRPKPLVLLLNKADLLSARQRQVWANYFNQQGIPFYFFCAKPQDSHAEHLKKMQQEDILQRQEEAEEKRQLQAQQNIENVNKKKNRINKNKKNTFNSLVEEGNKNDSDNDNNNEKQEEEEEEGAEEDDYEDITSSDSDSQSDYDEDETALLMNMMNTSHKKKQEASSSTTTAAAASTSGRRASKHKALRGQPVILNSHEILLQQQQQQQKQQGEDSEAKKNNKSKKKSQKELEEQRRIKAEEYSHVHQKPRTDLAPLPPLPPGSSKIYSPSELLEEFATTWRSRVLSEKSIQAGAQVMIGQTGFPNVGKSSTINAILGAKKVVVSATPGKTKHFQTLPVPSEDRVMLCDCPGLVFPSCAATKETMVCDGVLPIDNCRDFISPISVVCRRVPRIILEQHYHCEIDPSADKDHSNSLAEVVLACVGRKRGYMTDHERPNRSRAARDVLKDFVDGKMVFVHPPPGLKDISQLVHLQKQNEKKEQEEEEEEKEKKRKQQEKKNKTKKSNNNNNNKKKKKKTSLIENVEGEDSEEEEEEEEEDKTTWQEVSHVISELFSENVSARAHAAVQEEKLKEKFEKHQKQFLKHEQKRKNDPEYDDNNKEWEDLEEGGGGEEGDDDDDVEWEDCSEEDEDEDQINKKLGKLSKAREISDDDNDFDQDEEEEEEEQDEDELLLAGAIIEQKIRGGAQFFDHRSNINNNNNNNSNNNLLSIEEQFNLDPKIVELAGEGTEAVLQAGQKKKKKKMKSHHALTAANPDPDFTVRVTAQGQKQVVFDEDDDIDVFMPPSSAFNQQLQQQQELNEKKEPKISKRQLRRLEKQQKNSQSNNLQNDGFVKKGIVQQKQ